MARPQRLQIAGGLYHLTTRGVRQDPIYRTARDGDRFLVIAAETIARFGWECHAYCLMPNHYHFVVETPEPNVSAGMHRLNWTYARYFNVQYDFEGHVFDRRFWSVLIESDWQLLETIRYVVLNPVRAGLCGHPGEWRWSSYRATVGRARAPRFLRLERVLAYFGATPSRARIDFAAFVADGLARKAA
jgi:putative transposase